MHEVSLNDHGFKYGHERVTDDIIAFEAGIMTFTCLQVGQNYADPDRSAARAAAIVPRRGASTGSCIDSDPR